MIALRGGDSCECRDVCNVYAQELRSEIVPRIKLAVSDIQSQLDGVLSAVIVLTHV